MFAKAKAAPREGKVSLSHVAGRHPSLMPSPGVEAKQRKIHLLSKVITHKGENQESIKLNRNLLFMNNNFASVLYA